MDRNKNQNAVLIYKNNCFCTMLFTKHSENSLEKVILLNRLI